MKDFCIAIFLLLFLTVKGFATHIVGWQLFLQAIPNQSNIYTVGLTMYFDAINGDPGAEDDEIVLYFFRKRDNAAIAYLPVPKISRKSVNYANPECQISTLRTYEVTYSRNIFLENANFSDSDGYYIVWDRCCRNGTITNIVAPGDAGSLFYLEFPPVYQNRASFVNSSPTFPVLKGDYACVNTPFNFDFGGTDADGDSLVYTLITPRSGYSSKNVPSAIPAGSSNYPRLTWINGVSVSNMIPGSPPLTVNPQTGRLTVVASNTGLYVFAVQVQEYRNGKKIGELTRDFQLKVVDCPKPTAPQLLFKPKGSSTYYTENQIITVKQGDPQCFDVMATDASLNDIVSIRGSAISDTKNYFSILPAQLHTTPGNDTLSFQICLDDCFITYDNRPIRMQLIAEDQSCPFPLTDTLTIYIRRESVGNTKPDVTTSLGTDYYHVTAGIPVSFTVFGNDIDKDNIELSGKGQGFALASQNMNFVNISGTATVKQDFSWTPPCNTLKGDTLAVDFLISDLRCADNPLKNTKTIYFIVDESPNSPPAVSTSLSVSSINMLLPNSVNFQVTGMDADTNTIVLSAFGTGFNLADVGMHFTSKTGTALITSDFSWNPECTLLQTDKGQTFYVNFVVLDRTCASASDTITVPITISEQTMEEIPELPNVLTPNHDGKNDCLTLSELPEGTCTNQFKDVIVYNRWGKQVYNSSLRNDWCPSDLSAGYYLYVVRYTNRTIKSGLTILK